MLQLRAYAPPERVDAVAGSLGPLAGVRHVVVGGRTLGGMIELTGDVESEAADEVLDVLRGYDLGEDDVTLWRAASVQPLGWRRRKGVPAREAAVWTEVLGRAHVHARPGIRFLIYMLAAGVVAGVGVINGSSILVVGAMALSPDLLPISAIAVGLVERRYLLAVMAFGTLALGLTATAAAASSSTFVLRIFDRVQDDLPLAKTVLGPSLTSVGPGTILVALAAGMAGMLAYETAGRAAVGVAISVTTIPAAAYFGDAIALNGYQDALGGLTVLGVNVLFIVLASTVTLFVQRRVGARSAG
jgi:uncharacterized hydrophobic protein (TIGR00271 family)